MAQRSISRLATTYVFADALNRGAHFLLVPLYATYLTREEYGSLGALAALSALLLQFFGVGMSGGSVRFYHQYADPRVRREFLGATWLGIASITGLATLILDTVGGWFEPTFFGVLSYDPFLRLTIWSSWLLTVARTIPVGILRASEQAERFLGFSVVSLTITIGLITWRVVIREEGLEGVVRGTFEAALATLAFSLFLMRREWVLRWNRSHLRAALRYGLPLTPHQIGHWALALSDRWLIGRFVGVGALGLYHLAYQFGSVLQVLISAINNAVLPRFAEAGRRGTDSTTEDLRRLTTGYVATCAGLAAFVCGTAPGLIALALPAPYVHSIPLVPWIIAGITTLGLYYIPVNLLTLTFGRTERIAFVTVFAGVVNVGLNLALLPRIGVLAAALSTLVAYLTLALGVVTLCRGVDNQRSRLYDWPKIGSALFAALITGSVAFLLDRTSSPLSLLFSAIVVVSGYPTLLKLFGVFSTEDMRRTVSRICQGQVRR